MKITLEKGKAPIHVDLPDERLLAILTGSETPGIGHDRITEILSNGVQDHLLELVSAEQTLKNRIPDLKIAVIIPDDTRLWARGDLFVPVIVKTLLDMGAKKENIRIIIALGTHADMPEERFTALAGSFCTDHIKILNSANQNKGRLAHIGNTTFGTPVFITQEAVDADHIIIFGGVLHHLIAGFGGGRKYVLPGIAGYESVQKNHSLAIEADGSPHPRVQQGVLSGNPVSEDMAEAAALFLKDRTCTYAAVAVNGSGDLFWAGAGHLEATFQKGCETLDRACCVEVPQKGDFALISAGGDHADRQLYQSTKALFNAAGCVKPGGDILLAAGCTDGIGNKTFASVLQTYRHIPHKIADRLLEEFNMPAYVAFRLMDILNRFRVTLASDLDAESVAALGFHAPGSIEDYVRKLEGRGYVIPYAENILPVVKEK